MDHFKRSLRVCAQRLRREATKQENHLWYDFLRSYPVQFRRQMVLGRFIVDFYCAKAKLAIEVDGSQHFEKDAMVYDQERTDYLNQMEVDVIRFTNRDIDQNFSGVCEMIRSIVERRITEKGI